jgi:hypothetical protein
MKAAATLLAKRAYNDALWRDSADVFLLIAERCGGFK